MGFFSDLMNNIDRRANKPVAKGLAGQPKAPEGFTEFAGGQDRASNKISMEGKLSKQDTLYRDSVPVAGGKIPSIDDQTSDRSGEGKGGDFFSYGHTIKPNPFGEKLKDSSQMRSNINAVGSVKIPGFTTFRRPMQDSEYGAGNPQDAAAGSFYRNYLRTPKYGDLHVSTHNKDNPVGRSKVPVYRDGVEILQLGTMDAGKESDPTRKASSGEEFANRQRIGNERESGTAYNGTTVITSPPPPAPLRPISRKLPETDPTNDYYLVKYLKVNAENKLNLYKAKGDPVFQGGGLIYTGIGGDKQGKYTSVLSDMRTFGSQELSRSPTGTGIDKVDATGSSASNLKFTSVNKDSFGDEGGDLNPEDKSPLVTGITDRIGNRRLDVRNLKDRMEFVYLPSKVIPLIAADGEIRKTTNRLDLSNNTIESDFNIGENRASSKTDSVDVKNQKSVTSRRSEKYHPRDKLDSTPTGPESNKDKYLAPENTLIRPETTRAETSLDAFQTKYSSALEKLGMQGSVENYSDIKTLDVLDLLAKESMSSASQGKTTEPLAELDRGSLDSSSLGVEGDPARRYGFRFSRNRHYIHTVKKLPDYSASIVGGDDDGTNRIDQYNMYGILDAKDANLKTGPDWTDEDFVPLYFHDLVNKKYVPFRSLITSISDQSDATWNETQYLGRADKVYVYSGFTRTLSVEFNVVAFSVNELFPMWQRINYMVGLTKPAKYSENGFIIPPFVRFNLGDIYRNQPVLITSVSTQIPQEAGWELVNNETTNSKGADTSRGGAKKSEKNRYEYSNGDISRENVKVARYPTMCTLSISMTALEKVTPETKQNHFGNLGQDTDTFNGDLSKFEETSTNVGVGNNATQAPVQSSLPTQPLQPGTQPRSEDGTRYDLIENEGLGGGPGGNPSIDVSQINSLEEMTAALQQREDAIFAEYDM